MSLKSRLLQNRENRISSDLVNNSGIDLLNLFKEKKSYEKMFVYSYDKIFAVKNGETFKLPFSFASEEDYYDEINRIIHYLDADFKDKNFIVKTRNNFSVKIILPPDVKEAPYFSVERKKDVSFASLYEKKIVSSEITAYFKECLKRKANIFIVGGSDVSKSVILDFLIAITDKFNKNIICDNMNEIISKENCSLLINQESIKNISMMNYDNVFCSNLAENNLTEIFKLILSGYNGFSITFSVKNGVDVFSYLRNIILLNNPNLFEENADFLTNSVIDIIVYTEKNNEDIVVSKISEVSKGQQNNIVQKDIFVLNSDNVHVSLGNNSKFYNQNNITTYIKSYLEDNHLHSYVSGVINNSSQENRFSDKKEKRRHLKEKLKKLKQENFSILSNNSETIETQNQENVNIGIAPENNSSEKQPIQNNILEIQAENKQTESVFEKNVPPVNFETNSVDYDNQNPEDFEDFQAEKVDEDIGNTENINQEEYDETSEDNNFFSQEQDNSESDDEDLSRLKQEEDEKIINETLYPQGKIRNIFEEIDSEQLITRNEDSSEDENDEEYEESDENIEDGEYIYDEEYSEGESYEGITDKYSQATEAQTAKEPELFSEIEEEDVADYQDDFLDIDDDDI